MSALFKRWASRSATLRGFAYLFNPSALPERQPQPRKTASQIDDEAIAGDWLAIGDDLRQALEAERRFILDQPGASRRAGRRELVEQGA